MAEALAESDPFEAFNRAQGAGSMRDPYPLFHQMRARGAVQRLELSQALGTRPGGHRPPVMPDEVYLVLGYDAVSRVLRDGETFSSAGYARSMGVVMGRTILEMDEPEHSRHRSLLAKAFTRKALERWERELVRPVIHGLIDRFAERGRADLVRELTFPFPVSVIAGMMGLDEGDHADFHRWAVELISITIDPELGMRASQKLGGLFARVLAERRREPRGDLISVLAAAELDGQRLEDESIHAFLRLLAPAGAETTYRSSSNLLLGLLQHPDQLEAVRRDPALRERAIEEGLRWEPPLLTILRTATRDVELEGVAIPAGAAVVVNLGSANRDPAHFDAPDRFDVRRPAKRHLAFAFGPHRCLGMHLARMETRVLLDAVFGRLPALRLDPEAEDVHVTGMTFRAPLALPVVFDAADREAAR